MLELCLILLIFNFEPIISAKDQKNGANLCPMGLGQVKFVVCQTLYPPKVEKEISETFTIGTIFLVKTHICRKNANKHGQINCCFD